MDIPYLILNHCFHQEMPDSPWAFVRYCNDRGIALGIGTELIESLHEHNLLLPVFGIRQPVVAFKRLCGADGTVQHQPLQPGESWDGAVVHEYGGVVLETAMLQQYLAADMVVDPRAGEFRPWSSYGEAGIEGEGISWFYSPFQVIAAKEIMSFMRLGLRPRQLVEVAEGKPLPDKDVRSVAEIHLAHCRAFADDFERLLGLLLLVQSRYLPATRRSGAMIRVVAGRIDWADWCHDFDPMAAFERSEMSVSRIVGWVSRLLSKARDLDPLSPWKPFRDIVSHEAKCRLKGDALLCQSHYAAAEILTGLLRDIGEPALEEARSEPVLRKLYGPNWHERHHEVCGFVCARLGIHPEPTAVVYAEDEGLAVHTLPMLIDALGPAPAEGLGIEVECLHGTGAMQRDTMIARVEYLVRRSIPVWFIFDNENRAPQAWEAFTKRFPKCHPDLSTRLDQLVRGHCWKTNWEFTNFSDRELAEVLSAMVRRPTPPSLTTLLANARASFGRRGHQFEDVYEAAFGGGSLDKVEFARRLTRLAIDRPRFPFCEGGAPQPRPIIEVVRGIIRPCLLHSRPTHIPCG